jgi:eukaryotic-like serine/threonine-protein kinase
MNILRVGRYRVLQKLGGGGSGEVYVAEDTLLRRKVALKVLRERSESELQCAAMLNHPNIVTVYDVGHDGDLHYIATEFVEGETLRARLQRGPMTVLEALDVGIGVAQALVAAHEVWIVHRDLKPENIMLRRDRGVKVLDFGVAGVAGEITPLRFAGTLHYLSPEQVRGEPIVDTRSDIYSLGVVLYEMLSGQPPFTGEPLDLLASIVERSAPSLSRLVPPQMCGIVGRALRKSVYDRIQTAAEMLEEMEDLRFDLWIADRRAAG